MFLNKKDLFAEKIKKVPLKKTYKNYKGGKDFDAAVNFIKDLYFARIQKPGITPYVHVTCAIDTGSCICFYLGSSFVTNRTLQITFA